MTSKIKNKFRQFFYKPIRQNPHRAYMAKQLSEAEDALKGIGGMFKKRRRTRKKGKK